MEDSINNLGLVTTDKDVNDLAARHCEDAQVSLLNCWWNMSNNLKFFIEWSNIVNRTETCQKSQLCDQLAIYKAWRSWIRDHWRQIHLVAGRRI